MSKHRANLSELAIKEREDNHAKAKSDKAKIVAAEVKDGMAETIVLRRRRGEEIATPKSTRGEAIKPARVYDGWDIARRDYLKAGKRGHVTAGDKYHDLYRTGWGSGMSCGYAPRIRGDISARPASDVEARQELAEIGLNALNRNPKLIGILDDVCGRGETLMALAGGKHAIPVFKERLTIALDLLAVHMRMEV